MILAFTAFACGNKTSTDDNGTTEAKVIGKLVDNGRSAYTIVVPSDADECHEYAAEELRRYVERATGARLAIMSDDSLSSVSTENKYISLGKTKVLESSGITFDYSSLNGDGFYLKTVGNTLIADGARNTGVLYGAYEILESMFGVKFLTDDYTYVPSVSSVELRETDRKRFPPSNHETILRILR
ncbi:MAG: alpha-glucuronidase family glycosyl hydrolase [Christensenellales bacterium]